MSEFPYIEEVQTFCCKTRREVLVTLRAVEKPSTFRNGAKLAHGMKRTTNHGCHRPRKRAIQYPH